MGDKAKGRNKNKSRQSPPKVGKAGKHGLRPHEKREQADVAPALKKLGN
jgi:hypothetical protein